MDRNTTGDVEDLATLANLDDKILLEELKTRYNRDQIYTYVGDILVALNPYRSIPIYGNEFSNRYQSCRRNEQPPHIFAVADTAYQDMCGLRGRAARNQCVLISGESGAGKTESTKLIINQLIHVSKGKTQLEQQIIQVNPLLEAFGNAQTLMNDNSSRFGRYIQLRFTQGQVVGSKISEYLLEKSRVVQQNEGEENFHVFYYLFCGLTPDQLNRYRLKDPNSYRYFSDGADSIREKRTEFKENFDELLNAMDMVGFNDKEQEDLFLVLASVLHLGNVEIEANDIGEAVVSSGPGTPLRNVAELLGLSREEVHEVLSSSVTFTKGEEIRRNYSVLQAEDCRNALAKALYGRLFSWIVHKINTLLAPPDADYSHSHEIGILDIFGFEHFEHNSFEQACINLANEQLQFFFNRHVFTLEQEEYMREGIDWKEINFVDNQPLLDLFLAKPIGILSLLDEESQFPKGSDLSFVDKLNKKFDHDPHFIVSKQTNTGTFTIAHYAGKVMYTASGWLEKNRDTMPPGVMGMLQVSENTLLSLIFKGKISRTGTLALHAVTEKRSTKRMAKRLASETKARKLTVGAQFRNSLQVLMERMQASQPVFIRCIKPNESKKPQMFDDKHVSAQLLYTGMLQTTKIRREGYAVRPSFLEFTEKYRFLAHQAVMAPTADNCRTILRMSKVDGWQMGKTRVFLKYYHIDALSERLQEIGKKVVHIQRVVRGFLGRRRAARRRAEAAVERAKLEELLRKVSECSVQLSSAQNTAISNDQKIPKGYFEKKKPASKSASLESRAYLEPLLSEPPASHAVDEGTDMTSDSTSVSDSDEDDFIRTKRLQSKQLLPPGTRHASVKWFKETQIQTVMKPEGNGFVDWFHGIISRRESERLLQSSPIGCFLVRVSESRFGYTLSFRGEDRSRHYMIDQLPNGRFVVVGEPKVHRSLIELVEYYKKTTLSNWDHKLSVPCGQEAGACDYSDLVDIYDDDRRQPIYYEPESRMDMRSLQGSHKYQDIISVKNMIKMRSRRPISGGQPSSAVLKRISLQQQQLHMRTSHPPSPRQPSVQTAHAHGDSSSSLARASQNSSSANHPEASAESTLDRGAAPPLPERMYSVQRAPPPPPPNHASSSASSSSTAAANQRQQNEEARSSKVRMSTTRSRLSKQPFK